MIRTALRRLPTRVALVVAALAVGLLSAPAGAGAASAPTAAPLPTADGYTLPCANTSLDCVTLRFDNPDPSYLATKQFLGLGVATRSPSYLASVPEQFAWTIETSPDSSYVLIRQAHGDGNCLRGVSQQVMPGQQGMSSSSYSNIRLAACNWSDQNQQWYFRPVAGTDAFQIVRREGSCLSSEGGSPWGTVGFRCNGPRYSAEFWQSYVYQGDQRRLFEPLALKAAFASCSTPTGADTGRCTFTPDPAAGTARPVMREQCARIPGTTFPVVNNSDAPKTFTLAAERPVAGENSWTDAFQGSPATRSLIDTVRAATATYTAPYSGSVSDAALTAEPGTLTVAPHRAAWVFYRQAYLPVVGTWTFEKGTWYEWTHQQVVDVDVVGSGDLRRERVDNSAPAAENLTSTWTCTLRTAPEPADPNPSAAVVPSEPAVTAARITPDKTGPSTASDPRSLMVRLAVTSATPFRGQAVLLDGATELARHTMASGGPILTDTFTLPGTLAPGAHEITIRFVPDDPALFQTAEATLGVTAA